MTREEAIDMLVKDKEQRGKCFISEAIDMAVTALEQESVLDKIRAEIADYQKDAFYSNDVMMPKKMVLDILDKYKAESEDNK